MTRFENFMDLTQNNLREAENILVRMGISSSDAYELISRYAKEVRRLKRDLKHESERKWLAIRQRFEDELDEIIVGDALPIEGLEHPHSLLSFIGNSGPISINISNLSTQHGVIAQSIVEQELNGNITYTQEDKQLIELFDKYADKLAAIQLKSELDQLKDNSSPDDKKKTSKQRIVGFLYKCGQVIGDNAVKLLVKYIESQIIDSKP